MLEKLRPAGGCGPLKASTLKVNHHIYLNKKKIMFLKDVLLTAASKINGVVNVTNL